MKAFQFILAFFLVGLMLTSCEKDTVLLSDQELEERSSLVKLVPFKGDFQSFPIAPDLTGCPDPITGAIAPVPIYHAIEGNATHLGKIDVNQSPLYVTDCSFNAEKF